MQLSSIYLYPNRLDVYTNLDSWINERYRRVYQRNLKLYRGSDNRVEFRVKNSDQKPRNIEGKTFVITLTTTDHKLVFKKDCDVMDGSTGRLHVWFYEHELDNIEPGFYSFSICSESRTFLDFDNYIVTEKIPLYVDDQYGSVSTLEILGDISGEVKSSVEIKEFNYKIDFTQQSNSYYVSSIVNALPQTLTPQSLHTFQLFFTDYSGKIVIQGSLDISSPSTWIDLATKEYNTSTIDYINIIGKYNWFRIKSTPKPKENIGQFIIRQTLFSNYEVELGIGGIGYNINDIITIKGNQLGGETDSNDLYITVTSIGASGEITGITWKGISYNGTKQFIIDSTNLLTGSIDKILYR